MKKPVKLNATKTGKKEIIKGPVFKKSKTGGKVKLPKDVSINENIVTKTKIGKKQLKSEVKTKNNKPSKILQLEKNSIPTSTPLKSKTSKLAKIEEKSAKKLDKKPIKAAKIKNVLPSRFVTSEIAQKAVSALQTLAKQQQNKNRMFEDELNVFVQINSVKIQSKKTKVKINLPHSTVASTGEVCLITTDLKKGRKHDHEPSVDHWEDILRKAGINEVKTVMPLRQLRVEYDQFELKRRLLTQHDFILVDSRIHGHACHVLGKIFSKKHNMLISVRIHDVKDIKKNIKKALDSIILHINEGPTSTVMIGHMGMTEKQLQENVLGLVQQLSKKFPGGEQNIRTLSVKLPLSLAVPLYVTLKSKQTVKVPKIKTQLPSKHQSVEGELSTRPGTVVKVSPEGTITFKKNSDFGISDSEEEENSSEEELEEPKTKKQKVKLSKKMSDDEAEENGNAEIINANISGISDDNEELEQPKKKKQKAKSNKKKSYNADEENGNSDGNDENNSGISDDDDEVEEESDSE